MSNKPVAAVSVSAAQGKTIYPNEFAAVVAGRTKQKLGEVFGLANFGINRTTLAPGAASALMHYHSKQDEFVYVLEGTATIRIGSESYTAKAGECCGFRAGAPTGHQIVNQSSAVVVYLEIGDRMIGDQAEFPEDDLKASQRENGQWSLTHKNGEPY